MQISVTEIGAQIICPLFYFFKNVCEFQWFSFCTPLNFRAGKGQIDQIWTESGETWALRGFKWHTHGARVGFCTASAISCERQKSKSAYARGKSVQSGSAAPAVEICSRGMAYSSLVTLQEKAPRCTVVKSKVHYVRNGWRAVVKECCWVGTSQFCWNCDFVR